MKIEAKNRLVMTKGSIAARRISERADCYSWVWVIPLQSGKFKVAAIEVPKRIVDEDISFFEDDMDTPYVKIIDEFDGIDDAVREAGVDPEALDAPWHSEFPL